jgi:hypothetical protein
LVLRFEDHNDQIKQACIREIEAYASDDAEKYHQRTGASQYPANNGFGVEEKESDAE